MTVFCKRDIRQEARLQLAEFDNGKKRSYFHAVLTLY